ncbi:MAG TPA: serine protease [Rhizomicrobium sp.]|nr:serine protease [Rhizomicrobium sp.]
MRKAGFGTLALAAFLAGCSSAGEPSAGFAFPAIASAYLPLSGARDIIFEGHGAGMVIGSGIAVTNAHNANLVDSTSVIGASVDYDLLFFRTAAGPPLPVARPWIAEEVIAYGQGTDGSLREARGRMTALDAPVLARCPTCSIQHAFTFEADAGPGFSGGPVVDATDGKLVGIVFGYQDEKDGGRLMYGYDMNRVETELSQARKQTPSQ